MNNSEIFDKSLQDLARFAKVLSHPARLAILKYLSDTDKSRTGDLSSSLPLGRSTVSQHLKELRKSGLIKGQADGKEIYCSLCTKEIKRNLSRFKKYFKQIQ